MNLLQKSKIFIRSSNYHQISLFSKLVQVFNINKAKNWQRKLSSKAKPTYENIKYPEEDFMVFPVSESKWFFWREISLLRCYRYPA